jgi:hypothetical protein
LAEFVAALRVKARVLESSAGMKSGFQSFNTAFRFQPGSVSYSDYAVARLLFEGARDAGFWNLQWRITNLPPNSDNIWHQWKGAPAPSASKATAIAECDELSALYAFLAMRAGVRGVGLLWPTSNHTVAVWVIRQPVRDIRVVVPTTQIFLDEADLFATTRFDAWRQKHIYEYSRRDVPDSFELPGALIDYFLRQADGYAGASNIVLQRLRYLREAVFNGFLSSDGAAREALKFRGALRSGTPEDLAALQNFARDMRP